MRDLSRAPLVRIVFSQRESSLSVHQSAMTGEAKVMMSAGLDAASRSIERTPLMTTFALASEPPLAPFPLYLQGLDTVRYVCYK